MSPGTESPGTDDQAQGALGRELGGSILLAGAGKMGGALLEGWLGLGLSLAGLGVRLMEKQLWLGVVISAFMLLLMRYKRAPVALVAVIVGIIAGQVLRIWISGCTCRSSSCRVGRRSFTGRKTPCCRRPR